MIHIANKTYEVVVDHKNGWKPEAFRERYSEVLERYDFIVGDWGYNQLRLRGFFKDNHPKATKDSSISTLQDYLNEYCNFGCAYFIIEKVPSRQHHPNHLQDADHSSDLEGYQPVQPEMSAEAESETASVQQAESNARREPQPVQQHNASAGHQQQHHRKNQNGPSGQRHHRNQHHKQANHQRQSQVKEQQVKQ